MQLRKDVCTFIAQPNHKALYEEWYNNEFSEEERETDFK